MDPITYIIIVFIGVIATFVFNNHLQKKLLTINNKEKAIDLLIDSLKDFKEVCIDYWKETSNNNDNALNITIKYQQLNILLLFICKKYAFQNKQKIDTLFLNLYTSATGDNFDSNKKNKADIDKVNKISKLSNKLIIELLKNRI